MGLNLILFFSSLTAVSLISLLTAGSGALPFENRKENKQWNLWKLIAAVGSNVCICFLAHGIWTGRWNLLEHFADSFLRQLSYQQLMDLSLILLTMYAGSVLTGMMLRRCGQNSKPTKSVGRLAGLCCSSGLLLLIAILLFVAVQGDSCVLLSEFYLPDQKNTLEGLSAYVELANTGSLSYETEELYLSDDPNNLQKFRLSPVSVSPRETLLVPLDDNVFAFGRGGGDMLILSDAYGGVLDEIVTGETRKNRSYSRVYDDGSWAYRNPSPGVYNLEKPQFSVDGGFYEGAFYVELYAQEHADIYYTWDGSTPTPESEKYTDKILIYDRSEEENCYRNIQNVTRNWRENIPDATPVSKATVIRAIAVNADGFVSEIATATYFVDQNEVKENYVVSLVADPDDLFGPDGIYSTGAAYDEWYLNGQVGEEPVPNYEQRGKECAGNFELFGVTSEGYLNQPCGVRIQGGSHRNEPSKRMSIFAREEYSGSEFFDQSIYGTGNVHSVALREGLDNAFTMELVPGRNVATQQSVPVTVYLNGEYWYETYLQEKYSDEFFEEAYQLEDVEFIKAGVTVEMFKFVFENDMQTEDAYHRLNELIDIQSYIDFMCSNIYLANTDYAELPAGGNSAIWRSRSVEDDGYGDGRWRWALYDMDLITMYCRIELGLSHLTDAEFDSFTLMREWAGSLEDRYFYSRLKKNAQFREQFVLSFMDMANTCFSPEEVEPVLTKWGLDLSYHEDFFPNRKQHIARYMAAAYDLTGTLETLVLSVNDPTAGWIQVNTCRPNLSEGTWAGSYYTDYPVTVTAEARDGYRFVRWEGDISSESPVIKISLTEGGTNIHAIYEAQEK